MNISQFHADDFKLNRRDMESKFGMGIYTTTEASIILGLDRNKVSYWFSKYVSGEFKKRYDEGYFYDSDNIVKVNFYTLIETYVFYKLREMEVPTKKIIEAHNLLSKHHNTPYPFAIHKFLASGADLFHEVDGSVITLNKAQQLAISEVIHYYAENIDFGERFAEKYYPKGRNSSIVVNPRNQFGSPIIDGTNIKVSTILSLYEGGETAEFIANLYSIKEESVHDAIRFAA